MWQYGQDQLFLWSNMDNPNQLYYHSAQLYQLSIEGRWLENLTVYKLLVELQVCKLTTKMMIQQDGGGSPANGHSQG